MPRLDDVRESLIQALDSRYGLPPSPEPFSNREAGLVGSQTGLTLFERLSRVWLGLVATPRVAASAFEALRDAGMLEPDALAAANPLATDEILKNARVAMAIKSLRPLQNVARWLSDHGPTLDAEGVGKLSTEAIRDEWRSINGIGLARADALLLFGLDRVSYPIDRATYRVLIRHGWLDSTAEYDEARLVVERLAQADGSRGGGLDDRAAAKLLANLSFWFERLGRDFCKPNLAKCESCPLRTALPPNGPVEVE